jgi:hypothetical protein
MLSAGKMMMNEKSLEDAAQEAPLIAHDNSLFTP